MNGKGVVVVVETDDLIRPLMRRWLEEAGYTVIEEREENGKTTRATRPVLVIANVANPRGTPALIRSLQARHASPVLVLSARFQRGLGASTEAARRLGVRKILPKPFTRKEFLGAVKESIESP